MQTWTNPASGSLTNYDVWISSSSSVTITQWPYDSMPLQVLTNWTGTNTYFHIHPGGGFGASANVNVWAAPQ
jgi:hypothetical protein